MRNNVKRMNFCFIFNTKIVKTTTTKTRVLMKHNGFCQFQLWLWIKLELLQTVRCLSVLLVVTTKVKKDPKRSLGAGPKVLPNKSDLIWKEKSKFGVKRTYLCSTRWLLITSHHGIQYGESHGHSNRNYFRSD